MLRHHGQLSWVSTLLHDNPNIGPNLRDDLLNSETLQCNVRVPLTPHDDLKFEVVPDYVKVKPEQI